MLCSSSPLSCSIWHLDGTSYVCPLLMTSNGLELPLFWSVELDPASYQRLVLLRQSEAPPDTVGLSFASSSKYSWISDLSLCADPLCEGNSLLHLSSPIQRHQSFPRWLRQQMNHQQDLSGPFFSPRTAVLLPSRLNGKLVFLVKELCLAAPCERNLGSARDRGTQLRAVRGWPDRGNLGP